MRQAVEAGRLAGGGADSEKLYAKASSPTDG